MIDKGSKSQLYSLSDRCIGMDSLLNFIGPQFLIYKIKQIPTYPPFSTAVKIKWNNVGKPPDMPSTKYTLNKRTDSRHGMVDELQTDKLKSSVEQWLYSPWKRRKTKKAIAKEEKLIKWDIPSQQFLFCHSKDLCKYKPVSNGHWWRAALNAWLLSHDNSDSLYHWLN